MEKALHQGPWFVNGHYLSIIRWKPNFVATNKKLTTSEIWVRLPQLPTEFYDGKILQKIGNSIGRLLKINVCTSTIIRGHYARLCVEIPLDTPVQPFIYIGTHKQYIYYKGENLLCLKCERLGHPSTLCKFRQQNTKVISCSDTTTPRPIEEDQEGEWQTVTFNKSKRQNVKNNPASNHIPKDKLQGPGISVNLYNANTYEEHMILDNIKINKKNNTPQTSNAISHLDTKVNGVTMPDSYVPISTTNQNSDRLIDINKDIINPNKTTSSTRQATKHTNQQTTNPSIADHTSNNLSLKIENIKHPKHAIHMASNESNDKQMAITRDHDKDIKSFDIHPINLKGSHSEAV
ncbi:uncharacterized protein [Nicotiana sylvestris]|uniref:uncharacterized protein n=1 Tax=Nicotiana sylvestris TaxID=4096 RepID=UPI00388CC705